MAGDGLKTFASVLEKIVDNRGRTCPTAPFGIPLIATNCVRNDLLYPAYENIRFVDNKTYKTWFRDHPKPGDLLFVTKGSPGRVCIAPDPVNFCIAQDMVAIRADRRKVYPQFLFALLRSNAVQEKIEQLHVGTLIPHFKKGDFDKLLLSIPDRKAQEFIGDTYFDLCGKIDLNRRMSATLEAIARALFKSWFVDFDPVRAKAEGCDPSLPKHVADLFPDSFEDSELGGIPKGWAIVRIGEVSNVIDCLHGKKPARRESGRPLLQLENIRNDGLIDMTDTYFIDESDYKRWTSRMEASPGDCVITNVGRVGAVSQMPAGARAALGRNMTGIRCRTTFPFQSFLIECLLSDAMRDEIALRTDSGTILDALNVRSIPNLRFVSAENSLLEYFERVAQPIRQRMESLVVQSRTLTALRDTLLPKLISGDLELQDLERFVG
jgi:type I restriction enzyme S subunit